MIYVVVTYCWGLLWVVIERSGSLSTIYYAAVNCFVSFWVVVNFWGDVFASLCSAVDRC